MPEVTVMGAMLMCTFGDAPSDLMVLPVNRVTCGKMNAANIMDFVPMENILPFGMCMAPANPEFIAATAAALGTPTPVPCVPMTAAPWIPGSPTVSIGEMPLLDSASTCLCTWAGVISITDPGQVTTSVG